MTNLLEKSLLLGFSIFLLTIFSSILIPFLNEIPDLNHREQVGLEPYMDFFEEIDLAITYVVNNPDKSYLKEIEYPNDLNITFIENFVIYEFILGQDTFNKVFIYNTSFFNRFFHDMTPQIYLLNVSYPLSHIIIDFTILT